MGANTLSCICISLFSGLLAVLFIAVTVVGGIATKYMGGQLTFAFILIGIGVAGLIFTFFGFLGACHRNGKARWPLFLVIFYIAIIVVAIVFGLLGIACFYLKPTISIVITFTEERINSIFGDILKKYKDDIPGFLDKIKESLTAVGAVCFAVAGVVVATIIVTSCHMGLEMFSKFFIASASTIMLVVGVTIITVIAMFFKITGDTIYVYSVSQGVFVVIIVVASIMIVFSIIGYLSSFFTHRAKCLLFIFLIGVIALFLAFVALAIVALVIHGEFGESFDKYCKGTGNKQCAEVWKDMETNMCKHIVRIEGDNCEADHEQDVIKKLKDMFGGWLMIVFFFAAIVAAFLAVVSMSTCCACCKPSSGSKDDLSAGYPDYRAHKDVAY